MNMKVEKEKENTFVFIQTECFLFPLLRFFSLLSLPGSFPLTIKKSHIKLIYVVAKNIYKG